MHKYLKMYVHMCVAWSIPTSTYIFTYYRNSHGRETTEKKIIWSMCITCSSLLVVCVVLRVLWKRYNAEVSCMYVQEKWNQNDSILCNKEARETKAKTLFSGRAYMYKFAIWAEDEYIFQIREAIRPFVSFLHAILCVTRVWSTRFVVGCNHWCALADVPRSTEMTTFYS